MKCRISMIYRTTLCTKNKMMERINPQINALRAIKRKIRVLLSPKEMASSVPTIGLKTTGVRKARPLMPYRIQNLTTFRLRGENSFRSCRKVVNHQSRAATPPYEKITTDVLIPSALMRAVSTMESPAKMPVVGPITNLNMLTRKTVPYLKMRSPILQRLKPKPKMNFLFRFCGSNCEMKG